MKKIILSILISIILGVGILLYETQMNRIYGKIDSDSVDVNKQELEEILTESNFINIEKKIFSLKKHFYILVDDVLVGEITGRFMPILGDTLTLKDVHGNIIKSEKQVKRLGTTYGKLFNISLSRLAEINDKNGNITGFIGEERVEDMFKINHIQYFFDENTEKIGYAKPNFFMFCKDYKIYDNNKKINYIVDGNIFSLASRYSILVQNEENIDVADVIFYTIIEDSIINSEITHFPSNS